MSQISDSLSFRGEWEKCKVSDLLDFYSTNSLSWDKLEYGTTNIQNLHYGLIHVGLSTMVDIDKDNLPNIIDGNVPRNYELCKEGDIVLPMRQKIQTKWQKQLSTII